MCNSLIQLTISAEVRKRVGLSRKDLERTLMSRDMDPTRILRMLCHQKHYQLGRKRAEMEQNEGTRLTAGILQAGNQTVELLNCYPSREEKNDFEGARRSAGLLVPLEKVEPKTPGPLSSNSCSPHTVQKQRNIREKQRNIREQQRQRLRRLGISSNPDRLAIRHPIPIFQVPHQPRYAGEILKRKRRLNNYSNGIVHYPCGIKLQHHY